MISPTRWAKVEAVLDRALELDPEEAAPYLERACGDPALRDQVKRIYRACRRAEAHVSILDATAAELAAPLVEEAALPGPRPGEAVGPYRIERPLGRGGMGVVYLAHDPRLDRPVALKFLPPWLGATDLARPRFVREAKAASALDHPNVQTVYEFAETTDGRPYIALAYYEGETLAERIRRGALPVGEAVELACQLAEGLGAAHGRGIVHRDLKPGNVILTPDGVAKILDFGIALAMQGVSEERPARARETVGTLAYMSPEQFAGRKVDSRSDLWSLGVVLYEMLTGRRPFRGEGDPVVIQAIRHGTPVLPSRLRDEVPPGLDAIVLRLLDREPERRGAAVEWLLGERLDLAHAAARAERRRARATSAARLLPALLVLGALAAGYVATRGEGPGVPEAGAAFPASPASPHSVAVLPLDDQSPAEEHAYFARAVTEEITTALAKVPDLTVRSRMSAAQYPEFGLTLPEFARKLGVAHVIEGSVQRTDDRARITVQLIDARTDEHLWTETYDRSLRDFAQVQVEVARQVADRLAASFSKRARQRILAGSTDDPVAYDLFLQAMDLDREPMTRARLAHQIDLLRRATRRDPGFGQGWGELARFYAPYLLLRGNDAWADSVAAVLDRAIERTEDRGLRLKYRAWKAWMFREGSEDFQEAAALLREAVEENPWDVKLIQNLAGASHLSGDMVGATRWTRRRAVLDPLNPSAWIALAYRYIDLGLDRRAENALRRARELDPDHDVAWKAEALMRLHQGRYGAVLAAADSLEALESPLAPVWRGLAHLWAGDVETAHEAFGGIPGFLMNEGADAWWAAVAHARLAVGDTSAARRLLERTEALAEVTPSGPAAYAGLGAAVVAADAVDATEALRRYIAGGGMQARAIARDPVFARARRDPAFRAELAELQERVERMRRQVERDPSPMR